MKSLIHIGIRADNHFKLGDFNELVNFFITNSGKKEAIESIVK